ncbi:MAG: all-trans-retinol 13,14-reductase [Chlamydiales bacterium]|jgi:all-trans-retinol 13,14-reductase
MKDQVDYLVLGSGLSALSFSALMANKGHSVKMLEAHEHFGGYGHTFVEGDYKFNAQLHYVIGCGEGGVVNTFLKKIGLEKEVTFNRLNADGYDRVYCGDKSLNIPYGLENLEVNMLEICPEAAPQIKKFIDVLKDFRTAAENFPRHLKHSYRIAFAAPSYMRLFKYRSSTLQEVFDDCKLPLLMQTLVSGQLIDYLLPPKDLSFLVWAALFNAYCQGAYYPTKHFDHVIDSVVAFIQKNGGELQASEQVVDFIMDGKTVKGVYTQSVNPKTGICFGPRKAHYGKNVICNFDPKVAADMIGKENFSQKVQTALDYDYSYSSFVLYGVVKDIDLRDYGFGDWNVWHCQEDHNVAFDKMYKENDYSKPYFAMNCRSLHTDDTGNCKRDGCQILQICTVANYDYWKTLKMRDRKSYNLKKKEVLDCLLDAVEEKHVPNIRDHLIFKMTGSPTTNERFVFSPKGGAYGVNLTPRNFEYSRKLSSETSLENMHFCSAASGVGGFGGTIMTGCQLYEKLSSDYLD